MRHRMTHAIAVATTAAIVVFTYTRLACHLTCCNSCRSVIS